MIQTKLICALVILLASAATMQISTDGEVGEVGEVGEPILKDIRENVNEDEYQLIVKTIK